MRILALLILFFPVVFLMGCQKSQQDNNLGSVTGTVRHIPIEGGFYGIVSDDGERYAPLNLDPRYFQNGTRVIFEGKKCLDCVSFHMWGEIVEITKIKEVLKQRV